MKQKNVSQMVNHFKATNFKKLCVSTNIAGNFAIFMLSMKTEIRRKPESLITIEKNEGNRKSKHPSSEKKLNSNFIAAEVIASIF